MQQHPQNQQQASDIINTDTTSPQTTKPSQNGATPRIEAEKYIGGVSDSNRQKRPSSQRPSCCSCMLLEICSYVRATALGLTCRWVWPRPVTAMKAIQSSRHNRSRAVCWLRISFDSQFRVKGCCTKPLHPSISHLGRECSEGKLAALVELRKSFNCSCEDPQHRSPAQHRLLHRVTTETASHPAPKGEKHLQNSNIVLCPPVAPLQTKHRSGIINV